MKKKINILIVSAVIVAVAITLTVACSLESTQENSEGIMKRHQTKTLSTGSADLADLTYQIWWKSNRAYSQNPTQFQSACSSENYSMFYSLINASTGMMLHFDTIYQTCAQNAMSDIRESELGNLCTTCLAGSLHEFGQRIIHINSILEDLEDAGYTMGIDKFIYMADSCAARCYYNSLYTTMTTNQLRFCYLNCEMAKLEEHAEAFLSEFE